ncbi:MAG: hydantoinase/oxoprolinase N-terminal domain-containing protein [Gammaproteobacteria bacterium]
MSPPPSSPIALCRSAQHRSPDRRELYQLQPDPVVPPVAAEHCFETGGRVDAQGQLLEPLTEQDIQQLIDQLRASHVEAVAVNLLFSFQNAEAEQRLLAALSPHWFTSISSAVLAESGNTSAALPPG